MIFGRTYTKTIIWQNDVTSAPAAPGAATPAPTLAFPIQPRPSEGQVILGASAADIYFSGPCIATPMAPRAVKSTSVIQTPSGPFFGEMPPAPFIISRATEYPSGPVVVTRQTQDGATPDTSGPTPTTLVITRPRPAWIAPDVMTIVPPQAQAVFVVPPSITTHLRPARRGRAIVLRTAAAGAAGPGVAPYVKVPTQLALEAHSASVSLTAHSSGVALAAHEQGIALVAHATGLTLDAHGSQLTLEP